jgi:aminoacylase
MLFLLNPYFTLLLTKKSKWNTDPFAAIKDKDGNIFGRGTQDMKCVGVQFLEVGD